MERLTVIIIITDHDLFDFSVLAHLAPEVFVEGIEVVLQLACIHLVLGVISGVLVQVGQENGLTVGRLDVFSRAAVAVSASTNLVVERTVHLVHLRTEDAS